MYFFLLFILLIFSNVNSQDDYPTHLHYPIGGKRSLNDGKTDRSINTRPKIEEKIECASTSYQGHGGKFDWWYLQFENDPVYVTRIRIYSEFPKDDMKLRNIHVTVGNHYNYLKDNDISANENYICNEIEGEINSKVFDINCSYPLIGRIVSIQMHHGCTDKSYCKAPTALNLCEVEIYGYHLKEIIEEKIDFENDEMAVKQSNFVPYAGPSLAIVDKRENHFVNFYKTIKYLGCAEYIDFSTYHFYQLSLNDLNEITEVSFMSNQNTPDPLIIEVFVDLKKVSEDPNRSYGNCGYFKGLPKKINTVKCSENVYGKYVKLQVSRECEMEGNSLCQTSFADGLQLCNISAKGYPVKNYAAGKDTKQSHTHYDGISLLATDQQISDTFIGYNFLSSCTYATEKYNHPWWRIDLQLEYLVTNLLIYNMKLNYSLLHDVEIRIGNKDISMFYETEKNEFFEDNSICKGYSSKFLSPGGNFISCDHPLIGRYISIQIIQNCTFKECRTNDNINILALSEVEVYGTLIDNYYYGNVALEKDLTRGVFINYPVHLNHERSPLSIPNIGKYKLLWWIMDLQSIHAIQRIDVFTSEHFLGKRFYAEFHVGFVNVTQQDSSIKTAFNSTEICFIATGLYINPVLTVNCKSPIIGRYITILNLAECDGLDSMCRYVSTLSVNFINVWATKIQKLIFDGKKSATIDWSSRYSIIREEQLQTIQSSIRMPQCSRTEGNIYPWWQIDFLYDVMIISVSIWNIEDNSHGFLHDIEIRVGPEDNSKFGDERLTRNKVCFKTNGTLPKGKSTFHCRNPLPGRYLTIQITKNCTSQECPLTSYNVLTLCKVNTEGNYIGLFANEPYNLALDNTLKRTYLSVTNRNSTLAIDGKIPPLTTV